MENLLKIIIILSAITTVIMNANVVINRYDNECELDATLMKEIASYENVTKRIMEEVGTSFGLTMYQEYTQLIDTFGARPSGTEVLEKSIDHMTNLTKHNCLNDVTTEELEVPQWVRVHDSAKMQNTGLKPKTLLGLVLVTLLPAAEFNYYLKLSVIS